MLLLYEKVITTGLGEVHFQTTSAWVVLLFFYGLFSITLHLSIYCTVLWYTVSVILSEYCCVQFRTSSEWMTKCPLSLGCKRLFISWPIKWHSVPDFDWLQFKTNKIYDAKAWELFITSLQFFPQISLSLYYYFTTWSNWSGNEKKRMLPLCCYWTLW